MTWKAIAVTAAVVAAALGSTGHPGKAATPTQLVVIHAVTGAGPLDVYIDDSLVVAGLPNGRAAGPIDLANTGEHEVELFDATASPAASADARSDDPRPTAPVISPVPDRFEQGDDPVAIQLSRYGSSGERWWLQSTILPPNGPGCRTGFAHKTLSASTPTGVRLDGSSASGGGFGGGGTNSLSATWTQPVVIRGERLGDRDDNFVPPPFGLFDMGTVTFELGTETVYFAFGRDDRYGVAEVIVDCRTLRVTSVRNGVRSERYETSRFVPLTPVRLFDTRSAAAPSGPIPSGGTLDVQVAGQVGIPATDVTAVVMNVTATNSTDRGHVRVWPTGASRSTTANLNVGGPGETIPNLVTVPLGVGGKVSFFALSGLDLVADVAGYYVAADSATGGRFVPVSPARLFDTRTADEPSSAVAPETSLSVDVAGRAGVPASGVSAVVLNLTGVSTGSPGFVTAHPGGSTRPVAANLNLTGAGDVAPNLVIVPLGVDGTVDLYSKGGADLIGDVFGYFTDDTAPDSDSGLFVPSWPTRFLDSRPFPWSVFAGEDFRTPAGGTFDIAISGAGDIPEFGASAVLANLTGVNAIDRGFATIYPKDTPRPEVANLNLLAPGATRPNAVLVPLGETGDLTFYTKSGMYAVLDVFGYYTE